MVNYQKVRYSLSLVRMKKLSQLVVFPIKDPISGNCACPKRAAEKFNKK